MHGWYILIFITLGSQKFQFNRLLQEVDRLVGEKVIKDEVFAQIGYSDYIPQNYRYKEFLDREEFQNIIDKCDIVITHGGTGAIVGSIKKRKKVIAVPRLSKYGEHVDDHQVQIVSQFKKMNMILSVNSISEIKDRLDEIKDKEFREYKSNTNKIIESLDNFIKNI